MSSEGQSSIELSAEDRRQVETFLERGIKLPPQPKVLLEIDQLAQRPGLNNVAIAKVIAKDAGLTAALFRVVNSPAMGISRRIESVDSAITLLGLKQVINLVKSAALRQSIGGKEPVYERFWEHSGDIARLSALVAQKLVSTCNIFPDQAYMAGLFYQCGVPLLMQRFPEYCKAFRLADNDEWPCLADEDRLLNTDHCVAGYLVSRYWHLPDFISQAIRHHHDFADIQLEARTMVAILRMAEHLCHVHNRSADEADWQHIRPMVLEELGLRPEGLREFEEDILDRFSAASA